MSDKAHLNGAYYGPAIPPASRPKRSYHRHGRGGGGFCCLFDCLCGCIFSCIFKILFSILFTVGLVVLIFWLIFRPHPVRFHVDDARLTAFNLSDPTNNLNFNLAMNISVRNPNKKIGVYYDSIEARGYFEGQRFGHVDVGKFYQGHKNTTVLSPVLAGQTLIVLGADERSDFNEQRLAGVYEIDVKLYMRIRFKIGFVKSWRFRPRIQCDLKVPLSNGTLTAIGFQRTRCGLDF